MVSSEENSPHDEDNSRDEIETTQYPWYIREFKKLQPGHRFKMLVLLGLGAGIIYLFFQWFMVFPSWIDSSPRLVFLGVKTD